MRYQYDRPLHRSEVVVCAAFPADGSREQLRNKLFENSDKYGFSLSTCLLGEGGQPPPCDVRHSLAIIVADRPFDTTVEPVIARHLESYTQVSIALAYRDEAEMLSMRDTIEAAKVRYADRVNFLRPDRFDASRAWVSDQKIADNSVCDSVRIKYAAQRQPGSVELTPRERRFFEQASRMFDEHHLYHRSASDGYFLVRRGDGFLITATKTYKDGLDLRRISWVTGYDRIRNAIQYVGDFLPSSDAVEAAVLLERRADVTAVIHTHASDRWTRNAAYAEWCRVPEMPYGEPALGDVLSEQITSEGEGFVIMEEHGEVFWGRGPAADTRLLDFLAGCCERSGPRKQDGPPGKAL
ncbi:class II aldolase/adducin family protein [Paracidovorax oryzae]|uniref:class II aldolase/adducin family protein n=1 Tax=Paracidovorax oryzae TaxID=862720 RepID=UPI0035CF538F